MTHTANDPTSAFFDDVVSDGFHPMLHRTKGTIRLDLDERGDTTHWFVSIDHGDVKVSHRKSKADAVIHTTKELFDGMAQGKVNATAAMLRGVLTLEGDLGLVSSLARLLPGPPKSQTTFLERQKERAR
jgi:hypothetical protein